MQTLVYCTYSITRPITHRDYHFPSPAPSRSSLSPSPLQRFFKIARHVFVVFLSREPHRRHKATAQDRCQGEGGYGIRRCQGERRKYAFPSRWPSSAVRDGRHMHACLRLRARKDWQFKAHHIHLSLPTPHRLSYSYSTHSLPAFFTSPVTTTLHNI